MYSQFVITLIGIRNEVNPLAHKWELYEVGRMIDDAGAYGKITVEELVTLHALYKEIRDEIDSFDAFLQGC